MASESIPVNGWCRAAFGLGLVSLAFGVASMFFFLHEDLLAFCHLFTLLTAVTAIVGIIHVRRQRGRLVGYSQALRGLGCPAAFFGLMSLVLWSGQSVRVTGPRFISSCNLKQIGLAFHNYHAIHKRLPQAAICNADGRPLLSWRVALLPYLEEEELYRAFHLDEPWDSLHNIKLLERMPRVYQTPHRTDFSEESHSTFFQVFVGPGTPFEKGKIVNFNESFSRGTSAIILVADAASPVPWTKPDDLAFDPDEPLPALGGIVLPEQRRVSDLYGFPAKIRRIFVLCADGSVQGINPATCNEEVLRHAIVLNDGKDFGGEW